MKPINNYIFALALSIFFISCSDSNRANSKVSNFDSTLNEKKINIGQTINNLISLKGHIRVWTNKNDELIAYTETKTHKHIFILQYITNKLKLDKTFTNIAFLNHSFSLTSDSGDVIIAEIKNKPESKNASKILKRISKGSKINNIEGAGVVHIWLSKENEENTNKEISYKLLKSQNSVFKVAYFATNSCDSGGIGSTSCSTTVNDDKRSAKNPASAGSGCSVSCSSGYYACCNNGGILSSAHCECKPND